MTDDNPAQKGKQPAGESDGGSRSSAPKMPKIPVPKGQVASAFMGKVKGTATDKAAETLRSAGSGAGARGAAGGGGGTSEATGGSAAAEAKQALGNAAAGALQGAAQGAAGGAAGMAAGAARGAAISLAKDKNVQKVVLGIALVLVVIVVVNVMMISAAVSSITGALGGMDDQNANHVVEQEVESGGTAEAPKDPEDDEGDDEKPDEDAGTGGPEIEAKDSKKEAAGVTSAAVTDAQGLASEFHIPWPIVLAAREVDEDFDTGALANALAEEDPDAERRELTAGYTYTNSRLAMISPGDTGDTSGSDDEEEGDDDSTDEDAIEGGPAVKEDESEQDDGRLQRLIAAANVQYTYVTALTADDVGFSKKEAEDIFSRARAWATADGEGVNDGCASSPSGSPDGEDVELDGSDWSEGQVANMKVIIGIAKTMFGDDAKDAAIIGLITARVETSFTNYANDGKVGPEDNNMGGATAEDYAKLAYSLELPHDAVGTDHSSLGIMQQQAVWGWGDYGESTWESDPEGVIERLMDPAFVIAKFYAKLDALDWKNMDPGAAAQEVQISAYPDKYAKQVGLAEAIWEEYSDQSPLDVPEESGWEGAEGSVGSPGVKCGGGGGRILDGDVTWPVEVDDDDMFMGAISSDWGWRIHPSGRRDFHEGLDWTGEGEGSGIYAIAAGEVVRSETWPNAACGEYVEILHEDGTATGYLHQNTRTVDVGDHVEAGAFLGEMGGNQPGGCTFGAHLHLYTFDSAGCWMDPKIWLEERGLEIPEEKFWEPFPRGQTTTCS